MLGDGAVRGDCKDPLSWLALNDFAAHMTET